MLALQETSVFPFSCFYAQLLFKKGKILKNLKILKNKLWQRSFYTNKTKCNKVQWKQT